MTAIYAATSIAALQSLSGTFAAGDAVEVDGYYAMGDGGGGSFYFEGTPPTSVSITGATLSTKTITAATNASPIVITATGHGFTTGQSVLVSGVLGNTAANGKWLVTVTDADHFSLDGSSGNGAWSGTPQATSVTVTTSAAHGLLSGARLMIAGVSGMTGLDGTWSPIGVGSSTTFTVPASTTGSYTSGGFIGDGGVSFPSAAVGGRWLRRTDVLDARGYGLVPNDASAAAKAANRAALQAMLDGSNLGTGSQARITCHIPGGEYYFDDGIVVRRQVVLSGDGPQATSLHFPTGCVGMWFQYVFYEVVPGISGDSQFSIVSNLRLVGGAASPLYPDVVSPNDDHGIFFQASGITFRNLHVLNFGGDGFRSDAGQNIPVGHDTSSSQSRLEDCFSLLNHGWGFNIHDGDNNSGILMLSCFAQTNAAGDFFESSFLGNTYVGGSSHSELGGFKTTAEGNGSNQSTFVGMYYEGGEHAKVDIGSMAIGGTHASAALKYPDNTGVVLSGNGSKNFRTVRYKHATPVWTPNTTIAMDDVRRPSLAKANGRQYRAVDIGAAPHQTGGSEPTSWPLTFGGTTGTITEGNITWQEDGPLAVSLDWGTYVDFPSQNMAFALRDYSAPTADNLGWYRTKGLLGAWYDYWWALGWTGALGAVGGQSCLVSTPDSSTGHAYTGRGIFAVNKLMLGNLNYGIHFLDSGLGPPPATPNPGGAGPRWRGDLRFNVSPSVGTPSAWLCTATGSPGTWKPVGFVQDSFFDIVPQTITKWADTAATESSAAAAKTQVRARRRQTQTTTATANQVIDDGGSFGGEDFTLLNNAITVVDVTLLAKKNGSAAGGSIKLSGTFYRDAGGNCTRVGNDDVTVKLSGTTLDGTTADLNVNGTKIEVRVSPESAETLDWRIIRTQTEGAS